MDEESQRTLTHLIRTQRVAALGTLRQNAPFVSMVLCAPAPDFSAFFIHISRLAHHTQDILQDARVSLMIAQADDGSQDPQTLARVSLQGQAVELPAITAGHAAARAVYLERFPQAAFNFGLGDFALFRIAPKTARYVAGFGRIFNLDWSVFTATGG